MAEQPEQSWTLGFFSTTAGEKPAKTFLDRLTGQNRKVAIMLIEAVEKWGNQLRPPKSKLVAEKLYELRNPPNPVRIFYVFRPGRRIALLDGMVKKRDKIPGHVLARVQTYQREVAALDAKEKRAP